MINKQEAIDAIEVYRRNMAHILGDNDEKVKVIETCEKLVEEIEDLPSAQPERKKGKWVEKFDRIIRELGVNCAYDMPSFWCNQGKDYKVIPTKYHKGYMQALADVEKHMKGAEE